MRIRDLTRPLYEAPLPPDWKKSTFSPQTSFKKQLDYAMARAAKLGTGTGRVAFTIQHEGRPTVLKIAKNQKGLAQNEYEAEIMSDGYAQGLGITVPLIDYDEEHDMPIWLHVEKANKVKPVQFKKYFGIDHNTMEKVLRYAEGDPDFMKLWGNAAPQYEEIINTNRRVNNFVEFIRNYGIPAGDFGSLANWGIYKGRPVIIDLGLSQDVYDQYYKPKKSPRGW